MEAPTTALLYHLGIVLLIVPLPTSLCLRFSSTLRQGETVNSTQALVSADGNFVLQFFTIRKKSYLGISIPFGAATHGGYGFKAAWIANRNTPILDDSGALTFDNYGRLVIQHSGGNPIVLYSDGSNSLTSATLHENGNLVLSELNHNGSTGRILWQSFDYPTDTLLPGMKLGIDYQTGKTLSLTSWLSEENPASGAFTLDWNSKEQELVLKQRGVLVWTSGVLENGTFEHIQQSLLPSYSLMANNTSSGNFFSYFRHGKPYWKLDYWGDLTIELSDEEEASLAVLPIGETCFGQDHKGNGCVPLVQPKCRDKIAMLKLSYGDFHGDNGEIVSGTLYKNVSVGFSDCRELCWNDCDCMGFRVVDYEGCQFWRGKLEFVRNNFDLLTYFVKRNPELAEPPLPSDAMRKNWRWKTKLYGLFLLNIISFLLPAHDLKFS